MVCTCEQMKLAINKIQHVTHFCIYKQNALTRLKWIMPDNDGLLIRDEMQFTVMY